MSKSQANNTPKTAAAATETGKEAAAQARLQTESSEKWIMRMLVLAALVCGWMCFQGALGIFNGDVVAALPFAVVVQGVILIALWQMAYRPAGQKVVLATVWLAAALFSTGSAFFYADKDNWESVVIDARAEATAYLGRVTAEHDKLVAKLKELESKVAAEAADRGCGTKCKQLKFEASAAKGLVEAAQPAREAINAAVYSLNGLNPAQSSVQHVGAIVDQARSAAGGLAQNVTPPDLPDTLNFFERVSYVYSVILGMNPGKPGERFKFTLTLGLASLMEILGLLLSVIHVMNHVPYDPRPFPQRLANALGRLMNLGKLFENGKRYEEQAQTGVIADLRKRAAAANRQPKAPVEAAAAAAADAQRDWVDAINAQCRIMNKSHRELLIELLPAVPAALTAAKGAECPATPTLAH